MKQMSVVLKIFLIVGSIFILVGFGLTINKMLFINKASHATGIVVNLKQEITRNSDNHQGIIFKPEVQFQLEDGSMQTFTSKVGSNPPQFKVGSPVKVLYDPKNPQNAEVNTFITLWFIQIVFLFIGTVFLLISITGLSKLRNGKPLSVSYSIQLSGKEMVYLFFRKKVCPDCKGRLARDKKNVDMGVGISKWNSFDGSTYTYGKRYNVKYFYKCNECGKTFGLKQLIKD